MSIYVALPSELKGCTHIEVDELYIVPGGRISCRFWGGTMEPAPTEEDPAATVFVRDPDIVVQQKDVETVTEEIAAAVNAALSLVLKRLWVEEAARRGMAVEG